MHHDDPGIAELNRNILAFRVEVKEDFAQIREDLTRFLPREVYEAREEALEHRLVMVERARESSRNAMLGAFASFVVALVMFVISMYGGS